MSVTSTSSSLSVFAALWRLKPFVRPVIGRLVGGALSALAAAVIALMIPIVLEQIVRGLDQVAGTRLDDGVLTLILVGALGVLALALGEAAMVWLRRWFVLTPATEVEFQMRSELYSRLQSLPVAFHDRWQSGQLLSRMMQDLSLIRRWVAFGLILLVVNVLTIVIGAILLLRWHWMLGAIFIVTGIPLWIQGYLFEKRYGALARRSQDQAGDLATSVEESVHGIRVLKAFGRGKHALRRFSRQAETLRETELSKARAVGQIWFWLDLMPQVAFGLSLITGIWLISTEAIDVAELFAFFAMATVLRWPIESIGFLFSFMLDARTATDRVFDIYRESNTITDPEAPVHIAEPRGELAFEGARFRYQDAGASERDLLDGIDLVLRPGETMALVGLTGSGKTTLTTLPARLYDVTGGRITLDGVDIRDLKLSELRRHIAMAFEDATLFSASVRENVLLGRADLELHGPEADRVLREALEVAQAGFADSLPEGVETVIGEEGLSLSGGQRQRLALARAVAAAPKVLVLDDPLSALDVDTEALVEEALRHVLAETTALIVAHRPSTVALADRVALLEKGRITAVGTHTELLRTSSHYRHVISSLEAEQAARTGTIPIITEAIAEQAAAAGSADSGAGVPDGTADDASDIEEVEA